MDYNRIVIETIKQSFSDYVSTGFVEEQPIKETITKLNYEIDHRLVEGEPIEELIRLKSDLEYILYQLFYE